MRTLDVHFVYTFRLVIVRDDGRVGEGLVSYSLDPEIVRREFGKREERETSSFVFNKKKKKSGSKEKSAHELFIRIHVEAPTRFASDIFMIRVHRVTRSVINTYRFYVYLREIPTSLQTYPCPFPLPPPQVRNFSRQ